MHDPRHQDPQHGPGQHPQIGGHLTGAESGVLGVEGHRRILRSAGARRRSSAAVAVGRHGGTRRRARHELLTRGRSVRRFLPGRCGAAGGVPRLRPRRAPTGRPMMRRGHARHPRGATRQTKESKIMRVGVPREVKNREYRVALTPAGVTELVRAGHSVLVEHAAGEGSSIPDADYVAAGAQIVAEADDVWADADLLLKVKEPVEEEYSRLRRRPDAVHLPAPGGVQGVHRRAGRLGHHGDRLRDGADRGRRAAAAGAHVGGRRPDGAAGRGAQPGAGARRARRAARRRLRASTPPRSSSSAPACPA